MRLSIYVLLLSLSFSAWSAPVSEILTAIRAVAKKTTGSGYVSRLPIKLGVMGYKGKDLLFQMTTKHGTDILVIAGPSKKSINLVRMTPIMGHGAWTNSSRVLREANTKTAHNVDKKLQRLVNEELEGQGLNKKVASQPFTNLDLGDTTGSQFDL